MSAEHIVIAETIRQLERQHAGYRANLADACDRIARNLQHEAALLRDRADYYPNSNGILQSNALDIDRDCSVLEQQRLHLAVLRRFAGGES